MSLGRSGEIAVERIKDRADHKSNIHDSKASLNSKKKEVGFGTKVERADSNRSLVESNKPRKKKKRKNKRKDTTLTVLSGTRSNENNDTFPDKRSQSAGERSDSLSSDSSNDSKDLNSQYSGSND